MDRNHLTRRIRMLGIPILIPAAALVLVAYALPDGNEAPGPLTVHIDLEKQGKECRFSTRGDFRKRVQPSSRVVFRKKGNNWKDKPLGSLLVFLPTYTNLAQPTNASVAFKVLDESTGDALQFDVREAHMPETMYLYDIYVEGHGIDDFCEGNSHPGIIVEE